MRPSKPGSAILVAEGGATDMLVLKNERDRRISNARWSPDATRRLHVPPSIGHSGFVIRHSFLARHLHIYKCSNTAAILAVPLFHNLVEPKQWADAALKKSCAQKSRPDFFTTRFLPEVETRPPLAAPIAELFTSSPGIRAFW